MSKPVSFNLFRRVSFMDGGKLRYLNPWNYAVALKNAMDEDFAQSVARVINTAFDRRKHD